MLFKTWWNEWTEKPKTYLKNSGQTIKDHGELMFVYNLRNILDIECYTKGKALC